jgi:hypothetical protein
MYMREPAEDFASVSVTGAVIIALLLAAAGTVYLGVLPTSILDWSIAAAQSALR